jgi:hypothetical protein
LGCASQHAADVKAQHERREIKKIIKSMKEIHAHLNLQPPSSPIASKGEESTKIESFKEKIARFDKETLVQQWYGDASFSGFGFDYGGMDRASSFHPLLLTPLIRQIHTLMKKVKKAEKKMMTVSEAYQRTPRHFLVLSDKGGGGKMIKA